MKILLLLSLFELSASFMAIELEKIPLMFKCTKKLNSQFGICSHISRTGEHSEFETREEELTMISSAGVSIVRTDFDWVVCQPQVDGPFVFSQHQKMIESVKRKNLNILGILSPPSLYRTTDQYEKYVTKNVENYSDKIKYWEIINEVDFLYKRNNTISPKDYSIILTKLYKIIKFNNRDSQIIISSIDWIDNDFFEQLFTYDITSYFDILNLHWYSLGGKPETLIQHLNKIKSFLAKYNINKPIWITETGWTTETGFVSEDVQACNLPRVYLIAFACGIDKLFWYKSRSSELSKDRGGDYFGLWHKDYTPKPAFYAYQTMVRLCPDKSTRPTLYRDGDLYIAFWKKPNGERVWALWTSENAIRVNLNITKGYTAYSLYGQEVRIKPDDFEVSQSVVYIVGAKNFEIEKIVRNT